MKTFNIVLSGVGGQGVILASKILSMAGIESGYDVKQSEVHGMSQRGGSVTSHVRIGEKVYSPLITEGEADVVIAFELLEALRTKHWTNKNGILIFNTMKINPITVSSGMAEYPEGIVEKINELKCKTYAIDALELAKKAGSPKAVNMVLVGAASNVLPIKENIWETVLKNNIPEKILDINFKAFEYGKNCIQ